jgi:hypothetical protein
MAEEELVVVEGHLEKTPQNRLGYYDKEEQTEKHHYRYYRKTCRNASGGTGKGFTGPRHQIHHILPQTSIEESSGDHDDPEFLEDVKWITHWSINNIDNLVGLPTFASYLRYFHKSTKKWSNMTAIWFYEQVPIPKPPQSFKQSPQGHPIHNPVSWGHVKYNETVETALTKNVWTKVKGQRNGHRVKAAQVKTALESQQGAFAGQLARPLATRETWENRVRGTPWYLNFCMANPGKDPIEGG